MTLETGRWKTRRDLPVWVALAALLMLGWGVQGTVERRMTAFADPAGSLRVKYPAGWLAVPGSAALLEVRDPRSGAGVPTALIITREPRPQDQAPGEIAHSGIAARSRQLDMYRVLSNEPTKVAGKDAVVVSYAYVADPHGTVLELQRVPVVVRGLEFVVPAAGVVYHIDFRAADTVFDAARPRVDRILREVQL